MHPKISIIVPVYKAENYLHRCVDSLLAQTFSDFEVLLIDDGSPDRSGEICDEYAKKDNRIRVFHKENGGVSSARQCGIDNAEGEYTIHADPDDWVEATMLEELYAKAKEEDADMVICDYWLEYRDNNIRKNLNVFNTDNEVLISRLVRGNLLGILWNKLIRRDFINDNNISFVDGLNFCEDWIFIIKILSKKAKVSYLSIPFYHYDKYSNPNALTLLTTVYGEEQYNIFLSAYKNTITDINSRNYRTGFTFIAYWAFVHLIFTPENYKKQYGSNLYIFIHNDRNIFTKICVFISALGGQNLMWKLYRLLKRI